LVDSTDARLEWQKANFSMNFEPIVLHVYLPLSSSPGMTISYFCHDTKRRGEEGGGVQDLTS